MPERQEPEGDVSFSSQYLLPPAGAQAHSLPRQGGLCWAPPKSPSSSQGLEGGFVVLKHM